MNFDKYFTFLIISGGFFSWLFYFKSFSFDESKRGVEKKEKLVSIYLTIVAIVVSVKEISDKSILDFDLFLFFVSIIAYFMLLQPNGKKFMTTFCGITAAFTFISILVNLLVLSNLSVYIQGGLVCIVSMSLVWPFDKEPME